MEAHSSNDHEGRFASDRLTPILKRDITSSSCSTSLHSLASQNQEVSRNRAHVSLNAPGSETSHYLQSTVFQDHGDVEDRNILEDVNRALQLKARRSPSLTPSLSMQKQDHPASHSFRTLSGTLTLVADEATTQEELPPTRPAWPVTATQGTDSLPNLSGRREEKFSYGDKVRNRAVSMFTRKHRAPQIREGSSEGNEAEQRTLSHPAMSFSASTQSKTAEAKEELSRRYQCYNKYQEKTSLPFNPLSALRWKSDNFSEGTGSLTNDIPPTIEKRRNGTLLASAWAMNSKLLENFLESRLRYKGDSAISLSHANSSSTSSSLRKSDGLSRSSLYGIFTPESITSRGIMERHQHTDDSRRDTEQNNLESSNVASSRLGSALVSGVHVNEYGHMTGVPQIQEGMVQAKQPTRRLRAPTVVRPPTQVTRQHFEHMSASAFDYRWRAQLLKSCYKENKEILRIQRATASRIQEFERIRLASMGRPVMNSILTPEIIEILNEDPVRRLVIKADVAIIARQTSILMQRIAQVRGRGGLPDNLTVVAHTTRVSKQHQAISRELHTLQSYHADNQRKTRTLESHQTDISLRFHAAYMTTAQDYPEMQNITWMAGRYLPLKVRLVEALWEFGGPLLDFVGTNIAAPVVKTYGRRYMWPDVRDFIIIPYFKTEYTGGDPKDFTLTFPRRSITHWLCVLAFDAVLFISTKLAWDMSNLVNWISRFSIPKLDIIIARWLTWVVFRGAAFILGVVTFCAGVAAFGIIAAVLWWFMWYLSSLPGKQDMVLVVGSGVPAFLLASAVAGYAWWVVWSEPFWKQ